MVSVSIALATYNGEKFLRRQLESLAWQERLPDELVVCDDRSSDSTVAILHEFAGSAPFPVRIVVNDQSLHFRRNFMKAANLCTSDVILFCDQDDIWRPAKVAVVAGAFEDDPELLLAYHGATVVDADERPLAPMFNPAAEQTALTEDPPPPWHFARGLVQGFRRELLAFDDLWPATREHFADEPLGHDRLYFLLALALGRIRYLDQDLLMYRQHGANLYGSDRRLGLAARIAERLRHHPSADVFGAAAARSRANLLHSVRDRLAPKTNDRLDRLQKLYAIHAERLDRRGRTYTNGSVPGRVAALLHSIAKGDYCGNPWGFDPRSVLRDLWSGVVRGGDHSPMLASRI